MVGWLIGWFVYFCLFVCLFVCLLVCFVVFAPLLYAVNVTATIVGIQTQVQLPEMNPKRDTNKNGHTGQQIEQAIDGYGLDDSQLAEDHGAVFH